MLKLILIRFLVGGFLVSGFSILGTIFKPKSFAALFGAAPSVALATLALTIKTNGASYAALEARSMLAGAASFFLYAWCAMILLHREKPETKLATVGLLVIWLIVAMGLWWVFLKRGA
ncbi:MAG TPA: DUF3147 family protein [Candidatus Acidoferrum sp.]